MNTQRIREVVIAVLLVAPMSLWAQNQKDGCEESLKKMFAEEQKFTKDAFSSGRGWQIKYYASSSVFNGNTQRYEQITAKGEMLASPQMRFKKTERAEIYADETDIFSVNLEKKTILHVPAKKSELQPVNDAYAAVMHDSLLKIMKIENCKKARFKNKPVTCYDLVSLSPKSPYSKIQYYVNDDDNSMARVYITMNPQYQKQMKDYDMVILDRRNVKVDKKFEHVKDIFFTSAGTLKSPYEQYRLAEPK